MRNTANKPSVFVKMSRLYRFQQAFDYTFLHNFHLYSTGNNICHIYLLYSKFNISAKGLSQEETCTLNHITFSLSTIFLLVYQSDITSTFLYCTFIRYLIHWSIFLQCLYSSMVTCPCNVDHFTLQFYIVNLGLHLSYFCI